MGASAAAPASEAEILRLLDKYFPNRRHGLLVGRGDDCAILAWNGNLCVSTDLFLEDVHFRRSYFTAVEAGHKCLAVNLSDLAACGASPAAFTLSLALPVPLDAIWLEGFFKGMAALASRHGAILCGGDLSKSGKLAASVTVFGHAAVPLKRKNTRTGDILFATGDIGLARIGLEELEKNGRKAATQWKGPCAAHLMPEPHVKAGLALTRFAEKGARIALMDVSDGLCSDLPRLLAAGHGAEITLNEQNLSPAVLAHAAASGKDAALEAFKGGEDYVLLGACQPDLLPDLAKEIPGLRQLGQVDGSGQIRCNGFPMDAAAGFDHFGG